MNIYSLKEHLIYINMYTYNSDWHRQKQQAMSILLLLPSNARQCFSDATGKHVWFAHTLVTLNTHGEMQPPTKGLPEGYVPHDLHWTQWFSFTSVALGHFKRKHKTLTKPLQTFQQYSWKYKTFKKPQQKNVKASSEAVLCSSYKRLSRTRKKGKAAPGPGAHPCATNSATYLSLTHLQNTEEPSAVWQ